eukprot:SAG22_NODE_1317_length_4765_cov_2.131590_1_plen_197_part_10
MVAGLTPRAAVLARALGIIGATAAAAVLLLLRARRRRPRPVADDSASSPQRTRRRLELTPKSESAARKTALHAELTPLSVRDLRKRAIAAGVDGDALEDARDSENPKDEISCLIVAAELVDDTASAAAEREAALHAELCLLPIRELWKRAIAAGVDGDALEDARDSENPKGEISCLIVAAELVDDTGSAAAAAAGAG